MPAERLTNHPFGSGSTEDSILKAALDQWYDRDGIPYKVRADDGNLYILGQRTLVPDGKWDLVSFRQTAQKR